jgi:hypothetical protein
MPKHRRTSSSRGFFETNTQRGRQSSANSAASSAKGMSPDAGPTNESASDHQGEMCGGSGPIADRKPGMRHVEGKGFALDRVAGSRSGSDRMVGIESGSDCAAEGGSGSDRAVRNGWGSGCATRTGSCSDLNGPSSASRFEELQERLLIVRVHEFPVMPDFEDIGRGDIMASPRTDREDSSGERCSSGDQPRRGPPEP